MMSVVFGFIFVLASVPHSANEPDIEAPTALSTVEAEVEHAARDWLALGDEGHWAEAWKGTSRSFRESNTLESWTQAAKSVRAPLGAVNSRAIIHNSMVLAPAAGVLVIKFRTNFARKASAVETVSMTREEGSWRVTSVWVE